MTFRTVQEIVKNSVENKFERNYSETKVSLFGCEVLGSPVIIRRIGIRGYTYFAKEKTQETFLRFSL
ncbi:hypothetical protein COL71_05125 [Bacillus mycoides]|nr:hypothetical protein BW891_20320 [Bacillus mycoides]OOR31241.1 hypothetical protein BW894_27000 [Bacillus mycoides]OOR57047.1 hypothetical protein BGP34_16105 [Bacillus mycoides]PGA15053.1 hypothetical protein COL71_05125 [Bacillus mycoides]TXR70888.1 hypothetical protein DN408_30120 [Bacillus sp. AR13-1]